MNYLRYQAEDFIMDESFRQYCSGTDPVAVSFWEQWLAEHPERKEWVQAAKELYLQLNGGNDAAQFSMHLARFNKVLEERGIHTQVPARPRRIHRAVNVKWWSVAAAALLAGIAVIYFYRSAKKTVIPDILEKGLVYSSDAGERKSFRLPDGSRVQLNAGSTLTLEKKFNKTARHLALQGEAYFDVTPDASKPFVLQTASMEIRVLGTAFNVRAYPEDKISETSLIRGLIEVSVKGSSPHKVLLHPSEKLTINSLPHTPEHKTTATPVQYRVAPLVPRMVADSSLTETAWISDKLSFSDETLEEIARKLERWYKVKISIEPGNIAQYRFTGTFSRENVDRVLEIMQVSRAFNFKYVSDHHILISK